MTNIKNFMPKGNQLPANLGQQQGVRVDINTLKDMACIHCGEVEFKPVVRVKKLPAAVSPNGQEGSININMLKCSCGWIFNAQEWEKQQKENEKTVNVNETVGVSAKTDDHVEKNDDEYENKTLCRICGTFYEKDKDHNCKGK